MNRREALLGAVATALVAPKVSAQVSLRIATMLVQGISKPTPDEIAIAASIIAGLPKGGYVEVMGALADIKIKNADGESYNQRWRDRANPLLVAIWNDMGFHYRNDCQSFCGVTLGWCMQRSGRFYPDNAPSSQAWLHYGTPVKKPEPGDICVFTDYADHGKGHVTIFQGRRNAHVVNVLGANQLLSVDTTCGAGYTANIIDRRPMPLKSKTQFLNRFVRPPVPA